MTWFEKLTGFRETNPSQVRDRLVIDGETLTSKVNGRVMVCGRLETPSLSDLRKRVPLGDRNGSRISVKEVVANVQSLHVDALNAGSLFQVASQFNLLEMVSPGVTPERGVGIYEKDRTQGPACAVAAGAGTIYRNYFAPVNGQIGQSKNNQIDCLADLGKALGNSDRRLWQMQNGYALASHRGLIDIGGRLLGAREAERDRLRQHLRIGIQWNTGVTLDNCSHLVSQVYCSALPVAYSNLAPNLWEPFARLVLESAYEATFFAASLNSQATGNNCLFLTLLGGGAFGNSSDWIIGAIARSLNLFQSVDLDVRIVSYGSSHPSVRRLVDRFTQ